MSAQGMNFKYQIGQSVWLASWDSKESSVECPDCAGTGRIRCLLPDDTMVSIECEGCKRGYLGPTGRIVTWPKTASAIRTTIKGVEVRDGKVEWETFNSYRVPEDRLFDTEEAALAKAEEISAAADREELLRIQNKEKPTKSWAWHFHYYRRLIRDAEKEIERAKAKLAVANLKKRDDKSALTGGRS